MTAKEMRQSALAELRAALDGLYEIGSDPELLNNECRELKIAEARYAAARDSICRLNCVIAEFRQRAARPQPATSQ